MAQEGEGLDYECELVVVIGKKCTDVPESKALDYVLGYSVGNDISHREWQLKKGGGQWSLGKGFDGWAPFGPGIVSFSLIKDPQSLRISTKLNGKTMQVSEVMVEPRPANPILQNLDIFLGLEYRRHDLWSRQDHRVPEPRNNTTPWRPNLHRNVSSRIMAPWRFDIL